MNFLGNKENSDDLYWGIKTWEASTGEMRTRIFVLLGNKSVGRMLIPLKNSQELGLYANLLRIYGGNWMVFHQGLRFEVLDSIGEESFIFAEGLQFKVCWLRWGLGVWKFSSDGDMYLTPRGICISSVEVLNDLL